MQNAHFDSKKGVLVWILFILLIQCTPQEAEPIENVKESETLRPEYSLVEGRYNAAFLIMDGVYNTELTAPYDIFQHTIFRDNIKPINVFTVAQYSNPVKTFEGLYILPDFTFEDDNLPNIDILVVPSAEHHLDSDLENKTMIDFVKQTGTSASFVMSLCDGAFVLAQSGLLDSVSSTTFPGDLDQYEERFPHLDVIRNVSFVHDGKFITSAGGAVSFDAALYLAEHLYGKEVAERLAGGLVIDWDLNEVEKVVK